MNHDTFLKVSFILGIEKFPLIVCFCVTGLPGDAPALGHRRAFGTH